MKILKIISVFTVISTLFFCCSATNTKTMQKMQKNPPFKIISSEVTDWVGGQPGVRGIKVSIKVDNKDIKLDSIYFRNQKAALELVANSNPPEYISVFITSSRGINDFIIDKDATKEFGNKSKSVQEKIPFKLQNNEAIVSYQKQSKFFFYKIKNLK
ncbi:hypothetical protein [Lutibacter sp.]|uniref:hypothetical protein n=1 Tax=Lutibacter sp. TaxID=1925666 RepID=UPI0025BF7691|nr:hypothetical protein [Lutibacter sp.]MCF6181824.1 hypothetical protein [Lutibacter sp.]